MKPSCCRCINTSRQREGETDNSGDTKSNLFPNSKTQHITMTKAEVALLGCCHKPGKTSFHIHRTNPPISARQPWNFHPSSEWLQQNNNYLQLCVKYTQMHLSMQSCNFRALTARFWLSPNCWLDMNKMQLFQAGEINLLHRCVSVQTVTKLPLNPQLGRHMACVHPPLSTAS